MTRMAYLARDDHAIFDDNLGFFPMSFSVTDEMKLPPLQEGIIILAIFRLAIKVLPDLMNTFDWLLRSFPTPRNDELLVNFSRGNACNV